MGHWLSLHGIRFECVIGVTDPERGAPQEIVVNLDVQTDFRKAAISDSIDDTVDYRRLAQCIVEAGRSSSFHLIESLSTHLARMVFNQFPGVRALRLELEKPRALKAARDVKAVIVARRPAP
jgi:dihydroneopterin aldolase